MWRAFLLVCLGAVTTTVTHSADLSPAMAQLCSKINQNEFVPEPPTVRLPADSLLATISKTSDVNAINNALASGDANAFRSEAGTTALVYAVSAANWNAISVLLNAGADINLATKYGETPFERAIALRRSRIACQLLLRGATVPPPTAQFVYLLPASSLAAAADDAVALVTFFLDKGYPIDALLPPANQTALQIAAELGNTKLVRLLLRHGANPRLRNNQGDTAETVAKRAGHTVIVRLLNSTARTK